MDWQEARHRLSGEADFAVHRAAWDRAAAAWQGSAPMPAWQPDEARIEGAHVTALARKLGLPGYPGLHAWSRTRRDEFWALVMETYGIAATGPVRTGTLEDPVWFPGCTWNAVDACFRHDMDGVAIRIAGERDGDGQGEGVQDGPGAGVQDGPGAGVRDVTRGELKAMADAVSNGLLAVGLQPGDAIALYMPMDLDCVAAYLGIIQAGMVVVSIADSFAPDEVAARLRIADARVLVTRASYRRGGKTIDLLSKARAAKPERLFVLGTGGPTGHADLDGAGLRDEETRWEDVVTPGPFRSAQVAPETPSNILFSSGTTGDPKAIVWTHLTPFKAAMDGRYHQDIHEGDVVCWPTNIGWMMGPWLIYAALANGASVALYDGLPTSKGFLAFCNKARVTMLGVVPSLVRAWAAAGAAPGCLESVHTFSSTGEASNVHDQLYLMSLASYRAPVIEYCGGTEIGGGHITGTVVQPQVPAAFSTPALGLDLVVLDEEGEPVGPGASGEIFLVPPSIGLSQRLLNRDHHEEYYADTPAPPRDDIPLLRRHGDQVEVLPGGYWRAQGRADDTMNLGGIKVASIELERVMELHESIRECAAVGIAPPEGGPERLVVFAVPNASPHADRPIEANGPPEADKTVRADDRGVPPARLDQGAPDPDSLRVELQRLIRERLNPLFRIHDLVLVPSLPRTASNKIVRRTLRKEYVHPVRVA